MAKKKKTIELTQQALEFVEGTTTYKLIRFKPKSMTLDVIRYENGENLGEFNIPFAHLPKALKKVIKPKA